MSRFIAVAALSLFWLGVISCEKVPLLAPTGSTIALVLAETENVGLNMDIQVTAVVTEASGTPPQNGTVVTFTTSMGSINPIEARTTNGVATTTFSTGGRSGVATLRAFSGAAGTGDATAQATVNIGGAAPDATVALRVESTSNGGTTTVLVATVLDGSGNRAAGIPVTFTASTGQISPGSANTDGNGEARTTLTSSAQSEVTARAAGSESTVTINGPNSLTLEFGTGSTTPPFEVGQQINFKITPGTSMFFSNVAIDFGDGSPIENLGSVSAVRNFNHTYTRRGNFTVTATGTTGSGTSVDTLGVAVNDRSPINVAVTPTPSNVTLSSNQVVSFTATATVGGGTGTAVAVAKVEWSFGDGGRTTTTGLATSYRYNAIGVYTVTVKVTSTDGREGTGTATVRVSSG